MGTLLNRRRYMGASGGVAPLPYDAEIEYLEATGTQWISSDVIFKKGITVICEAQYTGDYNKTQILFGPGAGSSLWCGNVDNKGWGICVSAKGDSSVKTKVSMEYGTGVYKRLYLNDVLEDTLSDGKTSTNPIGIFNSYNGSYFSKAILWYIKFIDNTDNDKLLFDAIPVRIGTTGYLYDKVSKSLLGNAGTGDFILGNDKTT